MKNSAQLMGMHSKMCFQLKAGTWNNCRGQ